MNKSEFDGHARDILIISSSYSPSLKFTIFRSLTIYSTISTLLILAVCRKRVKYEPSIWPCSPWLLCSSVDRAPTRCLGGHRSCQALRFFICLMLVTCWLFYLHKRLHNRMAERGRQQNCYVWQTWQAYYEHVLLWLSLNIGVFWSFTKRSL